MPKKALTKIQIEKIVNLRKKGHSLPEIRRITKHSPGTVFKYIQNIEVLPEFKDILKSKQGGSKERAKKKWTEAETRAKNIIHKISERDKLMILLGIYWGEGTKRELNFINSDPQMIKTFVNSLYLIDVKDQEIKFSIRIFNGMDKKETINFWSDLLKINPDRIKSIEHSYGTKTDKLQHGMCRVRVEKSERYFKLIMSMIGFIKSEI